MLSKEQLQAILNIIPDGYEIEVNTKGSQKQSLREILLDEYGKKCRLFFTDENNFSASDFKGKQ